MSDQCEMKTRSILQKVENHTELFSTKFGIISNTHTSVNHEIKHGLNKKFN